MRGMDNDPPPAAQIMHDLRERLVQAMTGLVIVKEHRAAQRIRYQCFWQGMQEWISWEHQPSEQQVEEAVENVADRFLRRYREAYGPWHDFCGKLEWFFITDPKDADDLDAECADTIREFRRSGLVPDS
jgi:hypothetical protein